jgi:hypothetical protein
VPGPGWDAFDEGVGEPPSYGEEHGESERFPCAGLRHDRECIRGLLAIRDQRPEPAFRFLDAPHLFGLAFVTTNLTSAAASAFLYKRSRLNLL